MPGEFPNYPEQYDSCVRDYKDEKLGVRNDAGKMGRLGQVVEGWARKEGVNWQEDAEGKDGGDKGGKGKGKGKCGGKKEKGKGKKMEENNGDEDVEMGGVDVEK